MNDLTKGPVGKQLFYFAMPMLAANVFQQLYSIADSIVVGKFLGKAALAAVGASFPVIYRITSYNVCYTKLLRMDGSHVSKNDFASVFFAMFHAWPCL